MVICDRICKLKNKSVVVDEVPSLTSPTTVTMRNHAANYQSNSGESVGRGSEPRRKEWSELTHRSQEANISIMIISSHVVQLDEAVVMSSNEEKRLTSIHSSAIHLYSKSTISLSAIESRIQDSVKREGQDALLRAKLYSRAKRSS